MLTKRQERFCFEFVRSGNATQAYCRAFNTNKKDSARAAASALLRNANVQQRLSEIQAALQTEKICAASEVQERLSAIARRETTETVYLPNGQQVQRQTSIRDSVRALELLAKISGLFVNKSEIELQNAPTVVIVDDI